MRYRFPSKDELTAAEGTKTFENFNYFIGKLTLHVLTSFRDIHIITICVEFKEVLVGVAAEHKVRGT
jgi:hypothetical protein